MMGADAIAWLLASRDASVRYLTLTQVIGESPRSRQVRASREGISTGPRVSALLAGQRRDGGFGVHPYRKWTVLRARKARQGPARPRPPAGCGRGRAGPCLALRARSTV